MAIKLLSIDIRGNKELINTLNELEKVYTLSSKGVSAKPFTDAVENSLAQALGARVVQGKLGQREVVDLILFPDSPVLGYLYSIASKETDFERTRLEVKSSTRQAPTIGRLTLTTGSNPIVAGTDETLDVTAFAERQKIKGSGFVLELDPRAQQSSITNLVFDEYFKDQKLKNIFYAKARQVLLAVDAQSKDGSSFKSVGIITLPKKYFTKDFYKATRDKNAIVLSLRDSFQNFIAREIAASIERGSSKTKRVKFRANGREYTIDSLAAVGLESISYKGEVTNSLRTLPADTFVLRSPTMSDTGVRNKQRFISSIQWTALVQRRMGETMKRVGEPEPPDLKERSGRFRESIKVTADYRRNMLKYSYMSLYSALHAYGYKPNLQIERSIQYVAQQYYTREFKIIQG